VNPCTCPQAHNPFVRRELLHAAAVAFIASFCTLVIEISAGRILAPIVGVSLYTWTSIIGVVLAGISLGAWAGGLAADRWPATATLGRLMLLAGVATAAIAPFADLLGRDEGLLTQMGLATSLVTRVVALAFLLFFLPSFFLGMISPVAVKLAVRDLETTGSVVGKIYAVSTVGSILGTFVTGFWLVAHFGTRTTLAGVGASLLVTALFLGGLLPRRVRLAGAVVLVAALGVTAARPKPVTPPYLPPLEQPGSSGFVFDEESQYYRIRVQRTVKKEDGAPIVALHLDHLVHSYSDPADPAYLQYDYLRIFREVVEAKRRSNPDLRLLFIGGGGYTLPRLLLHEDPRVRIDVVEIDPVVTRVAKRHFGVPDTPRLRSIHEDARWFAMRSRDRYDVILIDAFNDLSVPYHLTTREAVADQKRLLAPGGVIVANLVDDFTHGRFLPSYAKTLEAVFGDDHVALAMIEDSDARSSRSTFVVMAGEVPPLDPAHPLLSGVRLGHYLTSRAAIVLTDDFAPVDNMLAPLFTDRFDEEQRK
jgi:predicted membrane-bound spermidine synthase